MVTITKALNLIHDRVLSTKAQTMVLRMAIRHDQLVAPDQGTLGLVPYEAIQCLYSTVILNF